MCDVDVDAVDARKGKWELWPVFVGVGSMVGFFLGFIFTLAVGGNGIATEGYRQGQIDALNGKWSVKAVPTTAYIDSK